MSWVPVDSSAASAIRYNPRRRCLDVEYVSGGRYRYYDVSAEVHQELLAADSVGAYLNQRIKPCYRYAKLPPARG